jgi:lipopolysaccharide assembly protein A
VGKYHPVRSPDRLVGKSDLKTRALASFAANPNAAVLLMRTVQALIFLIFLMAVLFFSVQNTQPVTVNFLSWSILCPIALLIVAVYLLGMLSGWTVVAFVTRSLRRVGKRRE